MDERTRSLQVVNRSLLRVTSALAHCSNCSERTILAAEPPAIWGMSTRRTWCGLICALATAALLLTGCGVIPASRFLEAYGEPNPNPSG